MSDNPFYERGMIRDPARFFGRQQELREIFDLLRTGQNVSVVGDSKIGKSSLLYYIYTTGGDRLGRDCIFIFLDLMRVTDEAGFYERVVEELGDAGNTARQL
ncbi:MAG: ATP-binding protein, partial [Deltaproteobacteria bacterium]|nr:ATP-binding protein [Deltaproteobacteria bacterium]